jgi:hypothetical protein
MNFIAEHSFAVLVIFAVLIVGMLMMDSVVPLVNELHAALSLEK